MSLVKLQYSLEKAGRVYAWRDITHIALTRFVLGADVEFLNATPLAWA